MEDHARNCEGRNYTCTCGYDAAKDAELQRLRGAMKEASDLLAERVYGSPARSPAHNARVVMEAAIADAKEETLIKAKAEWTQDLIDNAPLSLRLLGEKLSSKLTDDEWNNVEPMLISVSASVSVSQELLAIAKRWSALGGGAWHVDRYACEKIELLNDTQIAIAKADASNAS